MTEQEWLGCADPRRMLEALDKREGTEGSARSDAIPLLPPLWRAASTRLFRLGLAAAFRLDWDALTPQTRAAVEVMEGWADGAVTYARVTEAKRVLWSLVYPRSPEHGDGRDPERDAARTLRDALDGRPHFFELVRSTRTPQRMPAIVRDIFGNPFRPVRVRPDWLTTTAVGLARTIYEDRAFDRLPILADALEDAGCDVPALLDHCRGDGPHVRGCWVVDLVLRKE
ncbi:MAG TPA: hypothetical protein VM597_02365 [Gemmataceae bacterium]|nr:hypothetical protein [Gemmataceae bacterium]